MVTVSDWLEESTSPLSARARGVLRLMAESGEHFTFSTQVSKLKEMGSVLRRQRNCGKHTVFEILDLASKVPDAPRQGLPDNFDEDFSPEAIIKLREHWDRREIARFCYTMRDAFGSLGRHFSESSDACLEVIKQDNTEVV